MAKTITFNPSAPMSQAMFARFAGVNRSSVTRALEANKLIAEPDGKIIAAVWKNASFIRRNLIKAKRSLHVTENQRMVDQEVLNALHTDNPVSFISAPELYFPEMIKESSDDNFYYYEIGTLTEDEDFEYLLTIAKFKGREIEITVEPSNYSVTAVIAKGHLITVCVDSEIVTAPLYIRSS